MAQEADDILGDIKAAAEKVSTDTAPAIETVEQPKGEVVEATTDKGQASGEEKPGPSRDDRGRFAAKDPATEQTPDGATADAGRAKPAPGSPPVPGVAGTPATPIAAAVEQVRQASRAPASLNVTERAEWDKWPESARKFAERREKEYSAGIQDAAEARKGWQTFRETMAPYEPMFRRHGVDAISGLNELARQADLLTSGNQHAAAQVVAHWIRTVNLPVEVLAQALDNPQAQAPSQPQVNPASIQQMIAQSLQSMVGQAKNQKVQAELQEFLATEPEFWEQLKPQVESILRGTSDPKMTFKDAYEQAMWAHPETRKVLLDKEIQQKQQAATANAAASMQKAKQATTPKSSPTVSPPPTASMNGKGGLTDDLKAAMAVHNVPVPDGW